MRDLKIGRRDFLALGMTGAATIFAYGILRDQGGGVLLRPPGAQDESGFTVRCMRCGDCIRACLTQCLEPAPREFGASKLWTPRFNPALAKCEFELCGRACAQSCPVGAIARPADAEVRIGTAAVTRAKCIAWNEGKECLVCYERCSYAAIDSDFRGRPRVIADKCTGCGACQNTCVTNPDPAIVIYPLGAAPTETGSGGNGKKGG